MENFRSISLISKIAKIFERLIYERLASFMYKNQISCKRQYDFMKKYGRNALQVVQIMVQILYHKYYT